MSPFLNTSLVFEILSGLGAFSFIAMAMAAQPLSFIFCE